MINETLSTKQVILPPYEKLTVEDLEWCKYFPSENSLQTKGRAALLEWEIRKTSKEFSQWKACINSPSLFFDGPAKGNPGEVGTGRIIFDPRGKIVTTYA